VNYTQAQRVRLCCHNTDLVHVNGHDRIILVIFSQALYKAPWWWILCDPKHFGALLNILYWVRLSNKNCTEVSILSHYVFYGNNCGCQDTECKILPFLGAFAKLRGVTSSWNFSAPTGRIFIKFDIWVFFENMSRKFKFHLNRTRTKGTLHEDQFIFVIISRSFLFRMRNVSDKRCRENQNTHFMFSTFFPSENFTVYEIMWIIL